MARVVPGYREEARKRILLKAREVFAKNGYYATTMEDVATSVGVSKGALYQYFDSKEALFAAMVAAYREESVSLAQQYLDGHHEGITVNDFYDLWMEALSRMGSERLVFEVLSMSSRDDRLREVMVEDTHEDLNNLVNFLAELQRRGRLDNAIDVSLLARKIIALFSGLIMLKFYGMPDEECRRVWQDTVTCWTLQR